MSLPHISLEYKLPTTVSSIRNGWQWTCQSGAVVSGLLATAAAQLLVIFKDNKNYNPDINSGGPGGAKGFVIASCYAALFLNISASIGSFVLIDNLGEVEFRAASMPDVFHADINTTGRIVTSQEGLLKRFGISSAWNIMLWHWLFTYYSGIISLTVSVLAYVMMEEPLATKISLGFVMGCTLIPVILFILRQPFLAYIVSGFGALAAFSCCCRSRDRATATVTEGDIV